MKKWTTNELIEAVNDYINFINKDIMEKKYNRTFHNIQVKMSSIGIKRGYKELANSKEIIIKYKNNYSIEKLSKDNNVDTSVIKRILILNKVPLRRTTKKFNFNHNYFSIIDSEDKAYFLGFLFADGCNYTKEKKIKIAIHKNDSYILSVFCKKIELKKNLKYKNNYVYLDINSPEMSNQLTDLGCISNKTYNLDFPNKIPNHLINHFIRGFFDGDGCICFSKNKLHFNIVSTEMMLNGIQKIFINEIGLNKTKMQPGGYHPIIKMLKYGGNKNCKKIQNYLYKDATIFLSRKYEKFNSVTN